MTHRESPALLAGRTSAHVGPQWSACREDVHARRPLPSAGPREHIRVEVESTKLHAQHYEGHDLPGRHLVWTGREGPGWWAPARFIGTRISPTSPWAGPCATAWRSINQLSAGPKSGLQYSDRRLSLSARALRIGFRQDRNRYDWFTSRFPARYVHARFFEWPDKMLAAKTVVTPAVLPDGLRMSASERAVLELLYDAGTRQSLEEARNLFDGVRPPREKLMGQLLASCTNVKTVRLFLTWARESGLLDVDDLRARYPLRTGSDRRWMSRMPERTLLTLKPHG